MKMWIFALVVLCGCSMSRRTLEQECLRVLSSAATSSEFWVRVHGIEYLTALGYEEEAKSHVTGLAEFENVAQKRIGYWRCKYQLSSSENKDVWLRKIVYAYMDSTGTDRIHAAETLSKLGIALRDLDDRLVGRDLKHGGMLASFVNWGSALPGAKDGGSIRHQQLIDALEADDVESRKIAAYALSYIGHLPDEAWSSVARKALEEPLASKAYPYMINAAFSLQPANAASTGVADSLYHRLVSLKDLKSKEALVEMCRGLARRGQSNNVEALLSLITSEVPLVEGTNSSEDPQNVDVQAAAAFAIISITR